MHPAFRSVVLVAVLAWTPAVAAQKARSLQDDILARETAVWDDVKNKRLDAVQRVFSPDYAGVYDSGIVDGTQELEGIRQTTVSSYRIEGFRARRIDAGSVLATYRAVVDGSMNGKSISGAYNTMSVWHRTRGRWQLAAHTEIKAP